MPFPTPQIVLILRKTFQTSAHRSGQPAGPFYFANGSSLTSPEVQFREVHTVEGEEWASVDGNRRETRYQLHNR